MPADLGGARQLGSLTWTEVDSILSGPGAPPVALLPIGSTEAHGPHLPLETDAIISMEAARRAAARLAARGVGAVVLPCLAYAVTEFSREFPGTVGIGRETCLALVGEICRAVLRQGFAAVCLVNSHLEPDHLQALREAARQVADETGRPVLFPDKTRPRWAATLTPEFRSGACHAGRYETSLVMAVRADLVREEARVRLAANPVSLGRRIKEGAGSFREAGGDLAYFGDPAAASRQEGEATFEALAAMVETSVIEVLGGGRAPSGTPRPEAPR